MEAEPAKTVELATKVEARESEPVGLVLSFHLVETPKKKDISSSDRFHFKPTGENKQHS